MTWWPHDTKLAHDPVWDAIADDLEVAPCQVVSLYERLCDYAVTRGGSIAGFHPALVRRHLGLAVEQIARLIDKLREFDKLVGDLIPTLADVARKVTGTAGAATAAAAAHVRRTVSKSAERVRRHRARKDDRMRQGDLFTPDAEGVSPNPPPSRDQPVEAALHGSVTGRYGGALQAANGNLPPAPPSIKSDLEKERLRPFPLLAEGQPPPTPHSGEAPRAYRINSRVQGQNSRALGTNPRAQGVNPRAVGDNPQAVRENERRRLIGEYDPLQGEILLPIRGGRRRESRDERREREHLEHRLGLNRGLAQGYAEAADKAARLAAANPGNAKLAADAAERARHARQAFDMVAESMEQVNAARRAA